MLEIPHAWPTAMAILDTPHECVAAIFTLC